MGELMLDGNAIAGFLQEVFAVEMTTAIGTCGGCGAAGPVGAVHLYRGAGIVLRCPHCNNVLAKIVKNDSQVWIDFQGIRTLELAVQSERPKFGPQARSSEPTQACRLPCAFALGLKGEFPLWLLADVVAGCGAAVS